MRMSCKALKAHITALYFPISLPPFANIMGSCYLTSVNRRSVMLKKCKPILPRFWRQTTCVPLGKLCSFLFVSFLLSRDVFFPFLTNFTHIKYQCCMIKLRNNITALVSLITQVSGIFPANPPCLAIPGWQACFRSAFLITGGPQSHTITLGITERKFLHVLKIFCIVCATLRVRDVSKIKAKVSWNCSTLHNETIDALPLKSVSK